MTEAGWTREKPTEAGWYWWRRDQHALPGVAIVCSDLSGYYMNRTGYNSTFDHVDDVIGEWLGPITPDSYQRGRVAGLWEAVNIAREWPWSRGPAHTNPLHVAKRKGERDASGCIADNIESLIGHPGQAQEGVGG